MEVAEQVVTAEFPYVGFHAVRAIYLNLGDENTFLTLWKILIQVFNLTLLNHISCIL